MGADRAFHPAAALWRPRAEDRHARGHERNPLRARDRLPVAGAAQGLAVRSTVYAYFWEWRRYGVLDRIHHALLEACRERDGREASPIAGIIDSQSVKAAEKGVWVPNFRTS